MYKIYKNMTISRGQTPRQLYGLGSLVKSIKNVGKKAVGAVKDVVTSDLGKTALAAAALYYGGGGNLFGLQRAGLAKPGFAFSNLPGVGFFTGGAKVSPAIKALTGPAELGMTTRGLSTGTKVGLGIAGLSALGGALTPEAQADVEALRQSDDPGLLKAYLERYYRNLNPDADDETVASFVRANAAEGGRMQYAYGSPEENAMQASGVMGLPLNENPAGVTELDLRETGGFIPPVGVKEKADDIPAMLSNNEFVFTADAVRGMGDGDVNVGAQRMYDMMKKLENGGRV